MTEENLVKAYFVLGVLAICLGITSVLINDFGFSFAANSMMAGCVSMAICANLCLLIAETKGEKS